MFTRGEAFVIRSTRRTHAANAVFLAACSPHRGRSLTALDGNGTVSVSFGTVTTSAAQLLLALIRRRRTQFA
jgi:hypothetical protein